MTVDKLLHLFGLTRTPLAAQRLAKTTRALTDAQHHLSKSETARAEAEAARTKAETAQAEAETARAEAETARDEAERRLAEAEAARDEGERRLVEVEVARGEVERRLEGMEKKLGEVRERLVGAEKARAEVERKLGEAGGPQGSVVEAGGGPPGVSRELIVLADRLVDLTGESAPVDAAQAVALLRWLAGRTETMLALCEIAQVQDAGPVDPMRHEVVGVRAAPGPEQVEQIARTVRPGYSWRGLVLRPQQVIAYIEE